MAAQQQVLGFGSTASGRVVDALSVHASAESTAILLAGLGAGKPAQEARTALAERDVRLVSMTKGPITTRKLLALRERPGFDVRSSLDRSSLLHLDAEEPEAVLVLSPEAHAREGIRSYLTIGDFAPFRMADTWLTPLDLLHHVDYVQLSRRAAESAVEAAEQRGILPGTDLDKLSLEMLALRLVELTELKSTYIDQSMLIRPERTVIVTGDIGEAAYAHTRVLNQPPDPARAPDSVPPMPIRVRGSGYVPAYAGPIPGFPARSPAGSVDVTGSYAGAVAAEMLRGGTIATAVTIGSIVAVSAARRPGRPLKLAKAERLSRSGPAKPASPGTSTGSTALAIRRPSSQSHVRVIRPIS